MTIIMPSAKISRMEILIGGTARISRITITTTPRSSTTAATTQQTTISSMVVPTPLQIRTATRSSRKMGTNLHANPTTTSRRISSAKETTSRSSTTIRTRRISITSPRITQICLTTGMKTMSISTSGKAAATSHLTISSRVRSTTATTSSRSI